MIFTEPWVNNCFDQYNYRNQFWGLCYMGTVFRSYLFLILGGGLKPKAQEKLFSLPPLTLVLNTDIKK